MCRVRLAARGPPSRGDRSAWWASPSPPSRLPRRGALHVTPAARALPLVAAGGALPPATACGPPRRGHRVRRVPLKTTVAAPLPCSAPGNDRRRRGDRWWVLLGVSAGVAVAGSPATRCLAGTSSGCKNDGFPAVWTSWSFGPGAKWSSRQPASPAGQKMRKEGIEPPTSRWLSNSLESYALPLRHSLIESVVNRTAVENWTYRTTIYGSIHHPPACCYPAALLVHCSTDTEYPRPATSSSPLLGLGGAGGDPGRPQTWQRLLIEHLPFAAMHHKAACMLYKRWPAVVYAVATAKLYFFFFNYPDGA